MSENTINEAPKKEHKPATTLKFALSLLSRGINPVYCSKFKRRKNADNPHLPKPKPVYRKVVSPEDAVNFFTGQKFIKRGDNNAA